MEPLPHEKEIHEYVQTIEHLKKQSQDRAIFKDEIRKLEQKLELLKHKVYSKLTPWERVQICRHPSRPHSADFIRSLFDPFIELSGDRCFGDDHSIIGGIGIIGGVKCVVVGQEKGFDTDSRIYRNFGMLNPEGFRKALRLMRERLKDYLLLIIILGAVL